jgi:hypothetical protein
MLSYDYDNMSFYSDDEDRYEYDPTLCACSNMGERPVEECGPCLEYYTWHAAARVVSAMDTPTSRSLGLVEIRLLMDKFSAASVPQRVQCALALMLCVERHPNVMATVPSLRESVYDRCNAWAASSPEIQADCDHCREFLGSLRSRPDYIWSQREEIDSMTTLLQEGDDDWAISTAERLTVDQ